MLIAATSLGCGGGGGDRSVTFVQTDSSFHRDDLDGEVQVFIDRLPDLPYRSVGVIEVRRHDLQAAVDAAVAKAREVGCDFVIDRRIYEPPQAALAMPRWALASSEPEPLPVEQQEPPPPPPREFICGVVTL